MALLDPETLYPLRRRLEGLVADQHASIIGGTFTDMSQFERIRGIIVGLGMAMDCLDQTINPTPTETLSEGNADVVQTA